jgi:hypothetical protein
VEKLSLALKSSTVQTSTPDTSAQERVNGGQPRHPWGSYRASLAARALAAAHEVQRHGWSQKRAAALFGVNASYVGLVVGLDASARLKLHWGKLSLAQLWEGHVRSLAEFRAAKQSAQIPQAQPAPAEQPVQVTNGGELTLLPDAIVDRIIAKLGHDQVMRALDRVTQPNLPTNGGGQ